MAATPRDAVMAIPPYRPGRAPADVGVPAELLVRAASNESPFEPLASVRRAIDQHLGALNRYPEPRASALRAAIAEHVGLGVEHVTVGAGSSGLLWQLAQAFLDDSTDVVVPWPSFEAYPILGALMGAEVVRVPLRDHRADVEGLIAAVSERTALVVLAEPNNPTGTAVGERAVRRLVDATSGRCAFVVDEAYVEFDRGTGAGRAADLVAEHPHVVVLRTFSKAHGLAALRVGYALADPAVVDVLDRVAPPFAVSSVAQAAALASLAADTEVADRVDAVVAERERVVTAMVAMGLAPVPSATNFVWLPTGDAESLAAALEGDGVITRPVAGRGVRITIGDRDDDDRTLLALRRRLADAA